LELTVSLWLGWIIAYVDNVCSQPSTIGCGKITIRDKAKLGGKAIGPLAALSVQSVDPYLAGGREACDEGLVKRGSLRLAGG
jgi:hypothetical protein